MNEMEIRRTPEVVGAEIRSLTTQAKCITLWYGIEIGFNDKYIMEALKAAPADEIMLGLNTGSSPCVITPADGGDGFKYMILPIRLKS